MLQSCDSHFSSCPKPIPLANCTNVNTDTLPESAHISPSTVTSIAHITSTTTITLLRLWGSPVPLYVYMWIPFHLLFLGFMGIAESEDWSHSTFLKNHNHIFNQIPTTFSIHVLSYFLHDLLEFWLDSCWVFSFSFMSLKIFYIFEYFCSTQGNFFTSIFQFMNLPFSCV